GPDTPATAAGKQGASAPTVPIVSVAVLSRNLMAPDAASTAANVVLTRLTAASSKMPVAAETPRLAPLITPATDCVTEPVVDVRRTVLAAPAVAAALRTRLPLLQTVTSAGPVMPLMP